MKNTTNDATDAPNALVEIVKKNEAGEVVERIPARFISAEMLKRIGKYGAYRTVGNAFRAKLWRLDNPERVRSYQHDYYSVKKEGKR